MLLWMLSCWRSYHPPIGPSSPVPQGIPPTPSLDGSALVSGLLGDLGNRPGELKHGERVPPNTGSLLSCGRSVFKPVVNRVDSLELQVWGIRWTES